MVFFTLAVLLYAENLFLLPVVLPFGIIIAAQLIRAARGPGSEGNPNVDSVAGNLRSWHIAAVVIVSGSSLLWIVNRTASLVFPSNCWLYEGGIGCWVTSILLDLSIGSVVVTIAFAAMYLGKLHRNGHRFGHFLAFSVLLIPMAVAWNALGFIDLGSDRTDGIGSWLSLVAGLLGLALPLALLLLRGSHAKTWMWAVACFLLLVAIAGGNLPWNIFATLAAVAVGYAIYRIEWKRRLSESATGAGRGEPALNGRQGSANDDWAIRRRRRIRGAIVTGIMLVCVVVLVSVVGPRGWLGAGLPANVLALAALAIAATGGIAVGFAWRRQGTGRLSTERAAATFALLLAFASILHLIAMPEVEGLFGRISTEAQYWKPILGGYALVGAILVFVSTVTGWVQQIRPFAMVLILPAAILLTEERIFYLDYFLEYRDSLQTVIEAGITGAVLWAMWYAFGPGRARNDESAPDTNDTPAAGQAASEV